MTGGRGVKCAAADDVLAWSGLNCNIPYIAVIFISDMILPYIRVKLYGQPVAAKYI